MTRAEAEAYRAKIEHAAAQQSDADALTSIDLFPSWEADLDVVVGERKKYNNGEWSSNKLYKCVQAHHTQADWTPDATPALWTEVSVDEYPEWRQPVSAADAYNTGDKVTFEGSRYISLIDGNVWSPSAYPAGWQEVNS